MPDLRPAEVLEVAKQLEAICDSTNADREALALLYSRFDVTKDARVTTFLKVLSVLRSLQLGLAFLSNHLMTEQWWNAKVRQKLPSSEKKTFIDQFQMFLKVGFIQTLFSVVESALRLFLREIDPTACNGALGPFEPVYKCLLRSKLSTCPPQGIELLDLFRLTRNTIHNNGIYFDQKGSDKSVTWRCRGYEFKHGRKVGFVTWEFLLDLSDAVRILMRTVAEDSKLRDIRRQVADLWAT